MPEPEVDEQIRRLKNTIMGAAHRLSLLARAETLSRQDKDGLASISRDLADAAQRLERLLAVLRPDR
jgi:hypothetical protein